MKIAIGISGLYRSNLYFNSINSIQKIQEKFDADLYTHTWQGLEDTIPNIFKKEGFFFTSEEPQLKYHPLFDPEITSNPKHLYYINNKIQKEKQKFSNKQIIGYANLFDKIPKNYDIYIRTRWDVMINPNFNFQRFYSFLEAGPVGFMTREFGPNYYSFKKNEGKIIEKEKSSKKYNDWHDSLADSLIMHKAEQFDTGNVYNLHLQKQLLGSEFGWWQVMSKPFGGNEHTCIYGGVVLVRKTRKFIFDKEKFRIRRIFI